MAWELDPESEAECLTPMYFVSKFENLINIVGPLTVIKETAIRKVYKTQECLTIEL